MLLEPNIDSIRVTKGKRYSVINGWLSKAILNKYVILDDENQEYTIKPIEIHKKMWKIVK